MFKDLIIYVLEKEIIWFFICLGFCIMYFLMVVCGYVVIFIVGEWSFCEEKLNLYNYINLLLFGVLDLLKIKIRNIFYSEYYIVFFMNNDIWFYILFNVSVESIFVKL